MKYLILFILIFCAGYADAQNVVEWKFSAKKIDAKTYEVHLSATVDEPWHIYSQNTPKGGPLPTAISFTKNPIVQLVGKPKELGETEMYHDKVFDVDVYAYGDKVDFVQTVKLKSAVKTNILNLLVFA